MTQSTARPQKSAETGQKRRRTLLDDDGVPNHVPAPPKRWSAVFDDPEQGESPSQNLNSEKESVPLHQDGAVQTETQRLQAEEEEAALRRMAGGDGEKYEQMKKLINQQTAERYMTAVALDRATNSVLTKRRDPSTFTKEYIKRRRDILVTDEMLEEVMLRVSQGESIYRICRDDDAMPSYSTVTQWLHKAEWAAKYEAAIRSRADKHADEVAEASRELQAMVAAGANGDVVQAMKVHINTLQWLASRMNPQKWGDRVNVDMNAKIVTKEADVDSRLLSLLGKAGVNLNGDADRSSGDGE